MGRKNILGALCSEMISAYKRGRCRGVLCVLTAAAAMVLLSGCGSGAQKETAAAEQTAVSETMKTDQGGGAAGTDAGSGQTGSDSVPEGSGSGSVPENAADTSASGGQDQSEAQQDSPEASASRIESTIQTITSQPHSTGTAGEKAVAEYIDQYLSVLGYETTQMPFAQEPIRESDSVISGTNVIAVRHADGGAAHHQ